jgi:hypothetical protein
MSNDAGKQGVQGFQGVQGIQGEQGEVGKIGSTGDPGKAGQKGKSGGYRIHGKIGYALLAVGMSLGLFFQQKNFEHDLKENLHKEAVAHCINSISSVEKFNDLIYSLIETREQSRKDAIINRDKSLVEVSNNAIKRYKKQIITPKTPDQCENTVIP